MSEICEKGMCTITLPKECIMVFLVAGKNYLNRIEYLETQGKISAYKLQRLKATNVYDIKQGMEILKRYVD